MTNLKTIYLCAQVNFQKGLVNPRIYTVYVLTFAFLAYHLYGLSQFSAEVGHAVTPWIFAHLTGMPVLQVFAFLIVLLFCDAPFKDRHSPFLVVRTGRRHWIMGQLVYIGAASLIYTLFVFITSIIVLIPNVQLTMDWGLLIRTMANDPSFGADSVHMSFHAGTIDRMSAIVATLLALLYFWLVAIFLGLVILCFNTLLERTAGIVAAGCFIFISFYSMYAGFFAFGLTIYYFSPVSWMALPNLDWSYSGSYASPPFALVTLLILIALLCIVSVFAFGRKDMDIQDWGY